MKNVIFDVDDTLYDLMEPFQKAHKELMAARTDADCEELFEASRTYSDEAFCMSREGKSLKTKNLHIVSRKHMQMLE
jgi:hypothetical protein